MARRPDGPPARDDEPRGRPGSLATRSDLRRPRTDQRRRPRPRRLHPAYRDAIGRLPAGSTGPSRPAVPRSPAADADRRWLLLDREAERRPARRGRAGQPPRRRAFLRCVARPARRAGPPTCRSAGSRRSASRSPATRSSSRPGRSVERVVRRRFEVNEGIVGWGQGAFAAVPHPVDAPLDWRGPHPVPPPAGYAAPGDAGLLGILPGSWGPAQTGVADSVPSPTGDIVFWLYATRDPGDRRPAGATADGAARTARRGRRRRRRRGDGVPRDGLAARDPAAADAADRRRPTRDEPQVGGRPRAGVPAAPGAGARGAALHRRRRRRLGRADATTTASTAPSLVDLAIAPDATLAIGSTHGSGRSGPAGRGRDRRRFGAGHHRVAADADPARRCRDRRCGHRRADARPCPFRGARRPLPPAARASGRGQPGPQRGLRGGRRPRRMRPTRTSRAGSRSRCRPAPSRSRSSTGSATDPSAGRSRSATAACTAGPRRSSAVARPRRLDRGRLPRPLHLADVGAAPGPRRGRGDRRTCSRRSGATTTPA